MSAGTPVAGCPVPAAGDAPPADRWLSSSWTLSASSTASGSRSKRRRWVSCRIAASSSSGGVIRCPLLRCSVGVGGGGPAQAVVGAGGHDLGGDFAAVVADAYPVVLDPVLVDVVERREVDHHQGVAAEQLDQQVGPELLDGQTGRLGHGWWCLLCSGMGMGRGPRPPGGGGPPPPAGAAPPPGGGGFF